MEAAEGDLSRQADAAIPRHATTRSLTASVPKGVRSEGTLDARKPRRVRRKKLLLSEQAAAGGHRRASGRLAEAVRGAKRGALFAACSMQNAQSEAALAS